MKQKPTMADVALYAGVSPTTAARVLHGNGYVSEANREKVLKAAADLEYHPNIQARSLRYSRSFLIGVVLSSAVRNPFFARISHAIRLQANAAGLSILNFNHNYDHATEVDGLRRLLDHRVEAVILCHSFEIGNLAPIQKAGIPIIEIERAFLPETHKILIDPKPGLTAALRDLGAHGHRRIDFLGGSAARGSYGGSSSRSRADEERADAFLQAACDAGLDPRDLRVSTGQYDEDSGTTLEGLVRGRELLTRADRPTAIVAGSDVLAAGVLQAAYELGLQVPRDISIVGYDDSLGLFLAPALSSVRQPYEDIAKFAIEMALAGGKKPSSARTIETTYVQRSSVGAARNSDAHDK